MTHPMQDATDSRSCSNLDSTLAAVDANGDHMAKEDKPIPIEEVWEKGKSIPFTRDYEHHTFPYS
jgi:hypothetical protein